MSKKPSIMDVSLEEVSNGVLYEDNEFITRLISPDETKETFYNLIDKEQWNVTLTKINAVRNAFPHSYFVTVKKETREVIAVISVTPSHPKQFVVGSLVVRRDHRHRGHAKRLLKTLTEKHAQDTLTLTAVPGVDAFYSNFGFRVIEPVHEVYHIQVDRKEVDKAFSDSDRRIKEDISIACYTDDVFQALNHYDTTARGYDCNRYLSVMAASSNHFLVATSTTSGHVIGYAAGVDESSLLWIDGMYADSDTIALCIFRKMLEAFPQKSEVRIQTVKPREFLIGFGKILPRTRQYTRMSTGPSAEVFLSKLYAVADCDHAE